MTLIKQLTEGFEEQYQIYCDLDGVLADFDARFEHFYGILPKEYEEQAIQQYGEQKGKEKFWNSIDETIGVRFWRGIPWMPEGPQLWDYIKQFNPIILTAPSRNEVSRIGKRLWVQDNLGSNIPIEFRASYKKQELSGPGKILIDDRLDNVLQWKSKNGIGLLYEGDTKKIITELKKLGL
jgi:hypothetical protein